MGFVLFGYDNPLDSLPAPVVPIGSSDGILVAVFSSVDNGISLEPLDKNVSFVRVAEPQWFEICHFNPARDRLFALSGSHIVAYCAVREKAFFLSLLSDPEFSASNPFTRYSMAMRSGMTPLIVAEMSACVYLLACDDESLAERWYTNEKTRLEHDGRCISETLPASHRELINRALRQDASLVLTPLTSELQKTHYQRILESAVRAIGAYAAAAHTVEYHSGEAHLRWDVIAQLLITAYPAINVRGSSMPGYVEELCVADILSQKPEFLPPQNTRLVFEIQPDLPLIVINRPLVELLVRGLVEMALARTRRGSVVVHVHSIVVEDRGLQVEPALGGVFLVPTKPENAWTRHEMISVEVSDTSWLGDRGPLTETMELFRIIATLLHGWLRIRQHGHTGVDVEVALPLVPPA